MTSLNRRRFLGISAAAGGLALLPLPPGSAAPAAGGGECALAWRGSALGAGATIRLHHPDPAEAHRLIAACVAEIARLEAVFSLFRPDSALSRLNRAGALDAPPQDLVRLLSESAGYSAATCGAFDPTVQPLWRLYAEHFAQPDADPDGPDAAVLAATRSLVDWRRVRVEAGRIAFACPGMAVTLNGIAQGYITDRVIDLLRGRGVERVLADLGEIRSLGRHPDGSPWRVGLEDPRRPGHASREIDLENRAVATSGGYGTGFAPDSRFNHLFDPATGHCADRWRAVSVVAATATTADALSTALAVTPAAAIPPVLARFDATAFVTATADGARPMVVGARG
ncbi:MAG: FAD:protein FMN transferase [Azospirillum sp.]|nr:FAD:protein FMN transferase [Azospirillum sp.]